MFVQVASGMSAVLLDFALEQCWGVVGRGSFQACKEERGLQCSSELGGAMWCQCHIDDVQDLRFAFRVLLVSQQSARLLQGRVCF